MFARRGWNNGGQIGLVMCSQHSRTELSTHEHQNMLPDSFCHDNHSATDLILVHVSHRYPAPPRSNVHSALHRLDRNDIWDVDWIDLLARLRINYLY